MTEIVHVPLAGRAYDIHIGDGLIAGAGAHIAAIVDRPVVAVISDENVAVHHLDSLKNALQDASVEAKTLVLPAGEATKDWRYLTQTVEWLIAEKFERGDIVIALGGGVIGDLAGFAAAIMRRGIRLVQIPTTLLAQVDSSVGGKTGINSTHGKNLIGAFHQPCLVLADPGLLETLGPRDLRAGYGEVVKYGLLGDADFFDWLEQNGAQVLARDPDALTYAVHRCVEMKADIVSHDETEQAGRALLNLGHTFGHALEAATGYSDRLLHGEGVAIGCALAFDLSARLGLVSQQEPSRVRAHLQNLGLRARIADIDGALPDANGLLALMQQDKKVLRGAIRFVLARGIGQAFVGDDVDMEVVRNLLVEELAGA